jgi:hypothetical protein
MAGSRQQAATSHVATSRVWGKLQALQLRGPTGMMSRTTPPPTHTGLSHALTSLVSPRVHGRASARVPHPITHITSHASHKSSALVAVR